MAQMRRLFSKHTTPNEAQDTSPTGSVAPDEHENPFIYLYLVAGVAGTAFLACFARFTCRRVGACRRSQAEQRAQETAAGAIQGTVTRELLANGEDPSTPLLNDRRGCWERIFCARTTGQGIKADIKASLADAAVCTLASAASCGRYL